MKYGFKRILSIFLAVLMLASMLPLSVYADEEECLHEYTAEVTEPTCTEQGYTTYTCSLCGSSYEDDYTEASGHTPADAEEVPATCTESGRTAGTVCAVCGEALSGCEEIPASGHSYEAAVTEPTETEQGYTTYTCALCGDSCTDNYTGPNADGEELLNPEAEELSGLGLSLMASGSPEDIVESGTCGTSLTWKLDTNGLLTISGSGAMADYVFSETPWNSFSESIKSVIIKNGVTTIGEGAFFDCAGLASIEIPDSVTSIGGHAFNGCTGLTSITIPDSVKSIGEYAFFYSGLASITIPASVESIREYAFAYSGLASITIPASVKSIGEYAFAYSGLASITIPASVETIGSYAFTGCTGLTSITIPDSVKSIGENAFSGCDELADVFYKGTSDEWNSITIGSNNDCLTNAKKHYSVADFGECGKNLSWVLDTDGVLTISGSGAMADYDLWTTPWYSFSESIKSVIIENGVTSIGSSAFYGCTGLTSIMVPYGVTSIGNNAFEGCAGLTSITIPASVETIGISAFQGCTGLTSITIPASVETIGIYAFASCAGLTSITIPASVETIGNSAFAFCSELTNITIPASVTSIGYNAFAGCAGLTSVFFNGTEDQEKALRNGTAKGNEALLDITWVILKDKGTCGDNISWVLNTNGVLTISGTGVMTGYGSPSDTPWYSYRDLIKSVIIENGVTSIGSNAFKSCEVLTSVTLPGSVTSVSSAAFYGCSGLTSITIPDSVETIGSYAFKGCSNLASITLPESLTSIGEYAFFGCSKLASVFFNGTASQKEALRTGTSRGNDALWEITWVILKDKGSCGTSLTWKLDTNGVLTISGTGAMADYGSVVAPWYSYGDLIKSVVIEHGVTGIGSYAFFDFSNLTSITVPYGVTSIGESAFERCSSLTSITIPDSVKSIGEYAFNGCKKLTSITLPEGLTTIGDNAFSNCTGLTSITIPSSVTTIGSGVLSGCGTLTSISVASGNTKYSGDGNCLIEKDSGTLIRGCNNSVIPEGVTSIGDGAFQSCTGLSSITVPSSVTAIGGNAFNGCTGLTSITIPSSVKSIGGYAFSGCDGLTSVYFNGTVAQEAALRSSTAEGNEALLNIKWIKSKGSCGENVSWVLYPDGLLTISGTGAMADFDSDVAPWYKYCNLIKSAIIENGVTSIGSGAFCDCTGLTSITIPASVTTIGFSAFNRCTGLTSVFFNGTASQEKALRSGTAGGNEALLKITWVIPKDKGSCGKNLSWVLYADGTLYIAGTGAMADYDLGVAPWYNYWYLIKSAIIENGVTTIGFSAFQGCTGLTSITIPASVETIGFSAFEGCSNLTSITIPYGVKSIGDSAFYHCSSLASITIPDSVETIGSYAFYGCSSLASITVPYGVTSISEGAFEGCTGLTSITIPYGVKSIGARAFEGCKKLTSITIPASVETIGFSAFEGCINLTSITIPYSVKSIGEYAFAICSKLTNITIPDSVKSIGEGTFYGCDKLADVFYKGTSDEWNKITIDAFGNDCLTKAKIHHSPTYGGECEENLSWVLYEDGTLYIAGTGVMTGYGSPSDTPWYSFSESIKSVVIEHGVTSIGSNAFKSCAGLTSVTIPGSVTSVGVGAFNGCTGLENVYYNGTPLDWKKISIGSSNGCLTEANIICSFSLAEAIAISHDFQDITDETVDIDMLENPVYQLTATAAPDNAKQQFTWASSSSAVATVDTNGLVTFRKPGTVTITAAATDGSGKNAKVTFNVKYFDTAAKFTASTDVPSIGLEVGHRAQISVFGEDKTTALVPSMFEYTLSNVKNGPFIEVSGTGEITAIKPGGTTTVTAALKGDPLNRKVTVSVKTIPVQTKTVFVLPPDDADIHTANDNYAEGFCAINANGDIPSSADAAVSYALFVNKVPKGTTAEPRFVKVNAIDSDGNQVSLPNTDYTWTSSNTKIATVAKDGTITIKSNVDGACTITATSKDLAKAQGSIAVYVMDKTPRLDAAKVTLDVQKANTASVALVSSYGAQIVNKADVVFQEYNSKTKAYEDSTRIEIAGYNSDNGLLTLKASGFLKNQTIKGRLVVTTDDGTDPYKLPFNVVIKNSAPSVTVKQPSKFNLFYTDSYTTLNVSVKNEQIKSITLDSDYFKGTDNRDGTVTVTFKTPDSKPATKATLKIHLVGYEQPVEKAITIGTVTTKPKLTITPASAVINTLLNENYSSEFAVYNNATGDYITVADMGISAAAAEWASLDGEGTNAVLTLTGTTGGKAAISVQESNWASPITVYHTVNVKATDPVAKLGTGTLTLNSNFLNIAETTLTLDQANVSIAGINKDLTAVPKGVDKDVAEDWFKVAYADGKITAEFSPSGEAAIESGALKTGTYSFSITPYVEGVDLKPVTLKISVKNTIPTVTASAVTLNKRLSENGVSTLKLSAAGYTVTGIDYVSDYLDISLTGYGTLTVKLNSEAKALKAQTFNVTLTATVEMDGYDTKAAAKPFTLKVSMIDKAPSASVSASGKIDAVSRGTGITYTLTKLNNAVGNVTGAELAGDNASMFTLTELGLNDKGQPRYMLTLKDDAVCATNVTYKIMLSFTLDSGDVIETSMLNVKPSQSSLKLTAAPAAQIFYQSQSRDRVVTYTVKLTSPAGAEIGSIVPGKVSFWQNSLADQTKKIEISLDPNDKSMATVAITLKDTARFTSGKSYTLPLEVRAAGYAENTSVTKLNLTLKVMK